MKRISEPINTTELCKYGCGKIAKFKNGSGNLMCAKSHNSCSENKKRNSNNVKLAHQTGKNLGWKILTYSDRTKGTKGKFTADFSYGGKGNHKNVLITERGYKCECCKLSSWLDKPIVLELEHTDGDRKNNLKDNLKLLCPNCHSQTPTWRRGKRKNHFNIQKYSDKEIIEAVEKSSSLNQVLEKLDLRYGSVSTIVKIMTKYKVNFLGS